MKPVFVYGTLKQGFPNFRINKGTRVDGIFYTKHRYPFYLVSERHTPWLVLDEGQGHQIVGQLYMVDEDTMKRMDILEGIGQPDGYHKVEISIMAKQADLPKNILADRNQYSEEEVMASVYVKSKDQLEGAVIQLGPLKEYGQEHTEHYKPRNALVG